MRATWLEPDEEFGGVGAHPLNMRYDAADEEEPTRRSSTGDVYFPGLYSAAGSPRLDGIDISHYQFDAGPVVLEQTAAIPTSWFAAKATQSTSYVDPTFARARAKADAPGFRHKLAYHWLSSTTNAATQAGHFLRTVGTLHIGWGGMLDAEENGITVGECLLWCETVEAVLRRPTTVYTGLYVAGGTIYKSPELRHSKYGPRPIIVAAYVSEANLNARIRALGAPGFHAWQFSSDGPVAGIVGRCDMDRVDDVLAYDRVCGLTEAPEPTPGPERNEDVMNVKCRETGKFWRWWVDANGYQVACPFDELPGQGEWDAFSDLSDEAVGALPVVSEASLQKAYARRGRPTPVQGLAGPQGPQGVPGPPGPAGPPGDVSGRVGEHEHEGGTSGPVARV